MFLTGNTQSLELVTNNTATLTVTTDLIDHSSSGGDPVSQDVNINAANTFTIVSAPVAGVDRQIKRLTIRNTSNTLSSTITVKKDVGGIEYPILTVTLSVGETLYYNDGEFKTMDSQGRIRVASPDSTSGEQFGRYYFKVGTASEAAGVMYSFAKDPGNPGAWSPGTPGINGRATDGLAVADAGCFNFPDPATGVTHLTGIGSVTTSTGVVFIVDILWVNTGLVVTTTTAQAITAVAAPPRDNNGTSNGAGVQMGLLITGATTNAAAIANISAIYTDSEGNAGATATMPIFPATAVVGTVVPFQLAAGDSGVRAPQSVTFGTSLVAGSVSLILYRVLGISGNPVIGAGQLTNPQDNVEPQGVKAYNRTCGHAFWVSGSTNATTLHADLRFMVK